MSCTHPLSKQRLSRTSRLAIFLSLSVSFLVAPALASEKPQLKPVSLQSAPAVSWQVLTNAIQDHSSIRRKKAILALATMPAWPSVTKLLTNALHKDQDGRVRTTAATALGTLKARRALPDLRQALDDKETTVRFAAAQSLWKMGDHSGREILLNVLDGEISPSGGMDEMIKQEFSDANQTMHDPQVLAWMGAEQASGAFLGPFSIGVTMAERMTKDKGASARVLSATMLASDHDPATVRDLDESLGDKNWVVKAAAAKALGDHACAVLIPDLALFLSDKRDELKLSAATSILRITNRLKSGRPRNQECELLHGLSPTRTAATSQTVAAGKATVDTESQK
jgi:hypothetical protein